jgi:hypothetical protein
VQETDPHEQSAIGQVVAIASVTAVTAIEPQSQASPLSHVPFVSADEQSAHLWQPKAGAVAVDMWNAD